MAREASHANLECHAPGPVTPPLIYHWSQERNKTREGGRAEGGGLGGKGGVARGEEE